MGGKEARAPVAMVEQHWVLLLVKLAVAASVASFLARTRAFRELLLREERTVRQRTLLALGLAGIFGSGVAIRVITGGYQGVDLSLTGSLLAGILGGYYTGLLSGALIALPAMLGGELLSMPLLAGVGVMGGLVRDVAPDTEEIWRFSPFYDVIALYRLFRKGTDLRHVAFQMLFLATILFGEFLRATGYRVFGAKNIFVPIPPEQVANPVVAFGLYATTVLATALPLKIWNSLRLERKLAEQQRLAAESRLAALTYQINPHFLFNTLNTVSSLIRLNPEQARQVVYKLSNILRRLLRRQESWATVGEELAFIEDYLSIEVVRFGDKLRFEKEIDPAALTSVVPSMTLQPLVENSIKHGLSSKLEGGVIRLRCRIEKDRLLLVVEDDGVGIEEPRLKEVFAQGIGVSNVNERLKVMFGEAYRMDIDSRPGEGTRIEIEIPRLDAPLAQVS
jgi:two-component system LytT family sensor kinase